MRHAIPLRLRLFLLGDATCRRLQRVARRPAGWLRVWHAGLWLGLLDRPWLHRLDELVYDRDRRYLDPEYNRRGLWPWEEQAIREHFADRRRLVVIAAGGGREVLALIRLGFAVEAFECHPSLRNLANSILAEEGVGARVEACERDLCPAGAGRADGAIVGWGAYTLIAGRARRVALLAELRAWLPAGAPILLSFFVQRPGSEAAFRRVAAIAGRIRRLRGAEPPELGDALDPNFQHYFDRESVEAELAAAGFQMVHFTTEGYAHAVGLAVPVG